jgi:hypothetical protein
MDPYQFFPANQTFLEGQEWGQDAVRGPSSRATCRRSRSRHRDVGQKALRQYANGPGGLDLDFGGLAAALAALAALGLLYGRLALAVGAAYPSKLLALAIPAGWAARAYLVGGLHDPAGWLDPLRFLSPFWLVGQSPLRTVSTAWGTLVVIRRRSRDLGGGISARRAPGPRRA